MSSSKTAERLQQLISSATRIFQQKGYRRAGMADIARDMGVAPGTLYLYVESKEALFDLVIRFHWLDEQILTDQLPLPTPPPGRTLERLRSRLDDLAYLPGLASDDSAEALERLLEEIFNRVWRYREGIVLIERSAQDWPELADLFYLRFRARVLAQLTAFFERLSRERWWPERTRPSIAARFVIETIAWFAMHRYRDRVPMTEDDAEIHDSVIGLLVRALGPREP